MVLAEIMNESAGLFIGAIAKLAERLHVASVDRKGDALTRRTTSVAHLERVRNHKAEWRRAVAVEDGSNIRDDLSRLKHVGVGVTQIYRLSQRQVLLDG